MPNKEKLDDFLAVVIVVGVVVGLEMM